MNFYIDFEATQFSEEIISIGCVADNGNTFNRLVKPSNMKKVTKFITELTGISTEMLEAEGVSADSAFLDLYQFVKENNHAGVPTYYCYGTSDKNFLKKTISHMENLEAIIFASSMQALLVDYSTTVKSYLATQGLSLKKLVALIRHVDTVEQNHDALDDALMLKECYEGLDTLEKPVLVEKPIASVAKNSDFQKAYQKLIDEQGNLTPIKLQGVDISTEERHYLKTLRCDTWGQIPAEEVPGDATEENYVVKLTHIKKGYIKYFSSLHVAAMFFNEYVLKGRSPKDTKALNTTMKEFARHPNNFGGYRCEIKVEENV